MLIQQIQDINLITLKYVSWWLLYLFGRAKHYIVGRFHRSTIYIIDQGQKLNKSHFIARVFVDSVAKKGNGRELCVAFKVFKLTVVIDMVSCQIESIKFGKCWEFFEMLKFVIGNVQNGQVGQFLDVLYFGDLVLLHVQFFESVF